MQNVAKEGQYTGTLHQRVEVLTRMHVPTDWKQIPLDIGGPEFKDPQINFRLLRVAADIPDSAAFLRGSPDKAIFFEIPNKCQHHVVNSVKEKLLTAAKSAPESFKNFSVELKDKRKY